MHQNAEIDWQDTASTRALFNFKLLTFNSSHHPALERHKPHRIQRPGMKIIAVTVDHGENLFAVITHGHHQPAAIRQLFEQVARNIRSGAGGEDAIKRRFGFPAKTAIGVTQLRIQVSSVTSGTSDCRKKTAFSGSSPQARRSIARSRTFSFSSAAFSTVVKEWYSATK